MRIIFLIIQREYLVRVRKKSFLIMTILGPVLLACIYIVPAYLMLREGEKRTIAVIDESGLFSQSFENNKNISFAPINTSLAVAKEQVRQDKYYAVLYIPKSILDKTHNREVELFSKKGASIEVEDKVQETIQKKIQDLQLKQANIDTDLLKQIESYEIAVNTANLEEEKEQESNVIASSIVGYISAFIIYISIFLYGVQVMRGILEEKTNRIVEVMISSVKPFQLMMGKIIGIALVGLTQFLLWLLLGFGIIYGTAQTLGIDQQTMMQQVENRQPGLSQLKEVQKKPGLQAKDIYKGLATINFTKIIACLLFYFLFGYLMYSALFAAVGAASDADTDTQQFMFPISVPLIFSIVIATYIVQNPDSSIAFWTSIIPLTSPIIMLIRLPFNPPLWEIALSMALLIGGFLATTWLAARIYRVGILMYGKKVSYKELSKWLFYKG
ncbi:ABC transporter permease [Cytophagaceae bacterium DM2B3-1]|uniref:ABC transporter permease n=1 Tax=Xanthocytophaga flava TaxID=3048013 RepID=A0ABT7CW61_9BACT|nr:ABC transporter permease [Xanthocytophaga flavus]MDJ1467447.1 ABC transporter permease [Xanthocytophaga flavus]MDJ1498015.1 ABC transporter permease [Xanthocytophaga flavus]